MFSKLFKKVKIIIAIEENSLLLIATVVNMVDGLRLKIHIVKIVRVGVRHF